MLTPEILATTPAFVNLGVPELSIIVLLVLIFFGPGKCHTVPLHHFLNEESIGS